MPEAEALLTKDPTVLPTGCRCGTQRWWLAGRAVTCELLVCKDYVSTHLESRTRNPSQINSEQNAIYWHSNNVIVYLSLSLSLSSFLFLVFLFIDYREKIIEDSAQNGGRGETSICCSTYLCIHWLLLILVLTRDWTHNLGVLGRCSNQLSSLHFLLLLTPF